MRIEGPERAKQAATAVSKFPPDIKAIMNKPMAQRTPLEQQLATLAHRQLVFEYDLAANKLALLEDRPARKPAWGSVSPDDKTIVFVRNHNLYSMDAENYAKAIKNPNDASIQETQLTTDGIEDFGKLLT